MLTLSIISDVDYWLVGMDVKGKSAGNIGQ